MSSGDLDHNFFALGHHRRPSQLSDGGLQPNTVADHDHSPRSTSPAADESTTILPASTYARPSFNPPKRLSISTNFDHPNARILRNHISEQASFNEASPDPHEFYRQYHDPFANAPGGLINQGSLLVSPVEGMTASPYRRKSSLQSVHSNGVSSNASASASRANPRLSYRSSSTNSTPDAPLNSAKSTSALSASSRSRQPSLKELVSKFDQYPGEAPPLPSAPGSRSASRTASPSNTRPVYTRSRTTSASRRSGPTAASDPREASQERSKTPKSAQRKKANENFESLLSASNHPRNQKKQSLVGSNPDATQSLTDLNATIPAPRKPLFGEVISPNAAAANLGYGIPVQRHRRGSEGSMHSPNPMFSDGHPELSAGLSPISPTAWYLGYAPSLESVNTVRQDSRPPHRRTQSDFAGIPSKPAESNLLSAHMATMSPPLGLTSGGSAGNTSKRGSVSRIPVSTRRHSDASTSGNSSASTRANSAMGRYTSTQHIPPKGTSALPKPSPTSFSASRQIPAKPSPTSPRRRELAGQHPAERSPLLKANIIAPLPKKSPPLRSSRPRQPVSTASTSASRARAAERLSTVQSRTTPGSDARSPRQRPPTRLPGLENLDFAARRQKIRQAIDKTNEENARKEALEAERRRVAKEKAEKERKQSTSTEVGEQTTATPIEESTEVDQALTIDTSAVTTPSARNFPNEVSRFSVDDSPTLGESTDDLQETPRRQRRASSESDAPPMSAVTAGTAETDGTTFDTEPQIERPRPNGQSRTVLSQIMQMRDSSPATPSPTSSEGPEGESISERDDKESIQIMLRDTAYFHDAPGEFEDGDERLPYEVFANAGPRDRSSMSSWTSSIRDHHSAEGPMERIGENSPPQAQRGSQLSSSSAATDRTPQPWAPATVTSQEPTTSAPENDVYSTINQMHERFPNPSYLNHDMLQDFQRQILSQSPDLAKQGRWDPKKVTQMYLQELAKARFSKSSPLPAPLNVRPKDARMEAAQEQRDERGTEDELRVPEPGEKPPSEGAASLLAPSDTRSEPKTLANRLQRASLNAREDWENASPSIVDWMTFAAVNISPTEEHNDGLPPIPPPKDIDTAHHREQPSQSGESGPQLPEIEGTGEGLGLSIRVQSPQDADSPDIISPPAPKQPPPPPPMDASRFNDGPTTGRISSPSIYQSQPPSSVFGAGPIPPLPRVPSARTSEDSTKVGSGPSAQGSGSSFKSFGRGSLDQVGPDAATSGSPTPEQRQLTKRKHVIAELVKTEQVFNRDMAVVVDIYKGTCTSCKDLTAEDAKVLFGNSDQVVTFSWEFFCSLKAAARSVYSVPKSSRYQSKRGSQATSSSTTLNEQASIQASTFESDFSDAEKDRETFIGAAFMEHLDQMEKVYTEYLKNHEAANKRLHALQQNPKVSIWLQECQAWASDLTNAWDLDSLIVKPVQRILKYPLLLKELLEATPKDHPDFAKIEQAQQEVTLLSARINEAKKRAEMVEQVVSGGRKRNQSDVRVFKLGRRDKGKASASSETYEDKEFEQIRESLDTSYLHVQVVMRDVETYLTAVQGFMDWWTDFTFAVDGWLDVAHTSFPEKESKWRKCKVAVREITMIALPEHLAAIRKSVIEPMSQLLRLHESPKRVMEKRNKRYADFVRFRTITDRGDKADKKTVEQGEQYKALNTTLKEELPKLCSLVGTAIRACLHNFVQIRMTWLDIWQKKLAFVVESVPKDFTEVIRDFKEDFSYTEGQVLSLGITNGSLLADIVNMTNFLTPAATYGGDASASPRRPGTFGSSGSPDFRRNSSGFTPSPMGDGTTIASFSTDGRRRAGSNVSGRGPGTPDTVLSGRTMSGNPTYNSTYRPATSGGRVTDPTPQLPRLSIETPSFGHQGQGQPSPSPANRYSGFFSSAMPMSDSPIAQTPASTEDPSKKLKVLFLAASVYEFNIDRSRREAGYPYLTYVAGEIFDVIAEKGELWLARNQDDPTQQVGWIWNKHFAKLGTT